MAETWRRAIQKYGSLGAISFEKAFIRNVGIQASLQLKTKSNDYLTITIYAESRFFTNYSKQTFTLIFFLQSSRSILS
jgi:hypothetical protein